jgi:hypothetical protein
MNIELAHRVKTFGLAVAVLLATVAAGGNWLDHSVPLDGVVTSNEALSPKASDSLFVQSGGLVPDTCSEACNSGNEERQADTAETHLATAR